MDSFDRIYRENHNSMYRTAYKMIGDPAVVHDIIQEVFIHYYENLRTRQVITHPKAWLCRVTVNKCVDFLRKRKRFYNLDAVRETGEKDESLERNETREILTRTLSALQPRERILAVLYSEGLTYREMAEATGIRFSSIGKMLSRTLAKLERELKNHHYELY